MRGNQWLETQEAREAGYLAGIYFANISESERFTATADAKVAAILEPIARASGARITASVVEHARRALGLRRPEGTGSVKGPIHGFERGMRVRASELALKSVIALRCRDRVGTVVGFARKANKSYSGNPGDRAIRVRWDGRNEAHSYHFSFLEPIASEAATGEVRE